jgi:hypothetical protein
MKKIILYICTFLFVFTIVTFGQQKQQSIEQRRPLMEQKADSAIANRTIKRMKELFTISPEQEQALYKTEAFQTEMTKVDKAADSSYKAIVGSNNYQLYKEVLQSDLIRKQAIMKQRADIQAKDTLTHQN